jgi:hypothetical protein
MFDEKRDHEFHPVEVIPGTLSGVLGGPIALFQAQKAMQRGAYPFGNIVQACWYRQDIHARLCIIWN